MRQRWRAALRSFVAGAPESVREEPAASGSLDTHSASWTAEDHPAYQFLLAEYELLREGRTYLLNRMERLIGFVASLQTAELALFGLLVSTQSVSHGTLAAIILTAGLPLLLLAFTGYLRTIDAQIMNRRYTGALNAIRSYFVNEYPTIRPTVLLPTDPAKPSMMTIGAGSSMVVSASVTLLILTAFAVATVVAAGAWLFMLKVVGTWSLMAKTVLAAILSLTSGILVALAQFSYLKQRLRRAEAEWFNVIEQHQRTVG